MLTQPLRALWNEFVYGSHLLALAASCILLFSFQMLGQEIQWLSLCIPYCMMQVIYKFNYIIETGDHDSNPERAHHIVKKRKNFIVQIVVFTALLIALLIYYNITSLYIFCILYVAGGLWYPKQFTRYVIGFKNIYVTLFWALIGLIPMLMNTSQVWQISLILSLFIFLRVMVNAIFADFKDVQTDKEQGYKTLPAYLGIRSAMVILQFINILSFGLLIWGLLKYLFPAAGWALLIFMPYNMYYIQTANKQSAKNIRIISYILVDGEYILWPVVIWLGQITMNYLA